MVKQLEKPEELRISTNIAGTPLAITRNGKTERVTGIYKQWQESEQLFAQEVLKTYFKVRTSKGLICDVYRDAVSNLWYLSKVYE